MELYSDPILSENRLTQAWDDHVKGYAEQARLITSDVRLVGSDMLDQMNDQQLTSVIKCAGIYITTTGSLALRQREAQDAALYFVDQRDVIETIYAHKSVREFSDRSRPTDSTGYDFKLESARHRASYMFKVGLFTQDPAILTVALMMFADIAAQEAHPSVRNTAHFEYAHAKLRVLRTPENYSNLCAAYANAFEATRYIDGNDRALTLSSRMLIEAALALDIPKAIRTTRDVFQGWLLRPRSFAIPAFEIAKAMGESRRVRHWQQSTPPGSSFTHLALKYTEI
jgi:hypothetical protein